ncbi:MAG: YybS family protein [Anaerovibrio sp.]|uniref:YybS family protein n=1 Tax=Anaerovibrio sp. TaxID=1872532 RepID=UPI0025ED0C9B|nr:YybS family protein [Anaerovibrio sp.]MCR5177109.1 YybS family protein [Anaerovibrio sp.]
MAEQNIKSMTESGLLAAITIITALIGVYLPVLGTVAILIWPLPILILEVRHGMKWTLLSILASGIIMSILIEPLAAVRMVIGFAPPAIALGYGFRNNLPASKNLMLSLMAAVVAMLLAMGILFSVTGINPFNMQVDMLKESFEATMSAYEAMGIPAEQVADSKSQFEVAFSMITLLMPLVIICSGLITTWINFAIGGKVLRRLGHPVRSLPDFEEWRLPKLIIYFFAFSLIGLYWGSAKNIDILYQISLNVNILTTFAGFIQGIAIMSYFLHHKISRWVFWLIVAFIFLNGLIAQLVAFVGLFDMLFDYRKRFAKRQQ